MIFTVLRIGLLRLRNNPLELLLMFGVPIVFFSIFAVIFSRGIGSGRSAPVRVVFVDQDQSDISAALIERLSADTGIQSVAVQPSNPAHGIISVEESLQQVRNGDAALAIVFRPDFGVDLTRGTHRVVEILADTSDQIATQITAATVRQAVFTEQARLAVLRTAAERRSAAETLSPPQRQEVAPRADLPQYSAFDRRALSSGPASARAADVGNGLSRSEGAVAAVDDSASQEPQEFIEVMQDQPEDPVEVIDVFAAQVDNPKISMYAAGIAVMFLLFSASGAGGTLLEEQEAGTLERLLSSRLTLTQLLVGKWLFICSCGCLQLLVMFSWAQLVFDVDLVGHLPGFAVMTLSTAAAAASLALLLATLCRSRSQLNGVSVILILTMSALGGSMVPRFIMSEEMQRYGLLTFNAWALDGFNKIFWRNLPVTALQPQVTVLLISAVVMAAAARICARRWES